MFAKTRLWLRDESGAAALEYGLVLSLVSIVAIVALQNLGLSLVGIFERVNQALESVQLRLR
jgi:Flp pilus assembly pilin Flp